MLHYDIKPANAIVGPEGVVSLIDLGSARLADQASPSHEWPQEAHLATTPLFAQPPCMRPAGGDRVVTHTWDIYAGVVSMLDLFGMISCQGLTRGAFHSRMAAWAAGLGPDPAVPGALHREVVEHLSSHRAFRMLSPSGIRDMAALVEVMLRDSVAGGAVVLDAGGYPGEEQY